MSITSAVAHVKSTDYHLSNASNLRVLTYPHPVIYYVYKYLSPHAIHDRLHDMHIYMCVLVRLRVHMCAVHRSDRGLVLGALDAV